MATDEQLRKGLSKILSDHAKALQPAKKAVPSTLSTEASAMHTGKPGYKRPRQESRMPPNVKAIKPSLPAAQSHKPAPHRASHTTKPPVEGKPRHPSSIDHTKLEAFMKRAQSLEGTLTGKLGVNGDNWYTLSAVDIGVPADLSKPSKIPDGIMQRIVHIAEKLLQAEVQAFEARVATSSTAEDKWRRTALVSGTASDKLAAMTLLVQNSPVHALRHLDGLLSLARKKGRRESQQAIEALKDLFVTNLLPSDRKLLPLASRDFLSVMDTIRAEHLALWQFEDALKRRYAEFLTVLQEHLGDAIVHFKSNALKTVVDLLIEKPEQEGILLSILVNKLGDPDGKVASKAQYLLSQLVVKHEAMKPVVVREVRQFLIRPHLSHQAQYFAVIFLNQLTLSPKLPTLATELIQAYMGLFDLCVKRGELTSKLLGGILTGINRAFPYSDAESTAALVMTHVDVLFEVVHKGSFGSSVQALTLIQHLCGNATTSQESSPAAERVLDRYFRALYSKITLESLESASKYTLFLNLIFRSCRRDQCIGRTRAILKRLLQVAAYLPPTFAAGAVLLVAEVLKIRPDVGGLFTPDVSAEDGDAKAPETNVEKVADSEDTDAAAYDPWKRDPKYAGGSKDFIWELVALAMHFHPSVRKFADHVLSAPLSGISYGGDPLADFSVRFAIISHGFIAFVKFLQVTWFVYAVNGFLGSIRIQES